MIVSCGLASIEDINETYGVLRDAGAQRHLFVVLYQQLSRRGRRQQSTAHTCIG